MLRLAGFDACAAIIGDVNKGTEEFKRQLEIARRVGVPIFAWQRIRERPWDAVIDPVFGVGLSREIEGDYRLCIEAMNALTPAPSLRAAVDIPSGIHADTGQVMGIAFRADVTAAFGWEKQGTVHYPGREYAGSVQVEDIGFPAAAIDCAPGSEGCSQPAFTYGPEDLAQVPARKAYSNKGTFGRVLIAAGSRGMCGAAYLRPLGAYRAGAGLVKILTVEESRQVLQGLLRKGHPVVQPDLPPGQLHVRGAGLAHGAPAQHGDRHILQIFHIAHHDRPPSVFPAHLGGGSKISPPSPLVKG